MPVFDTPEPVTIVLTLPYGDTQILASDRTDTVVTVDSTDGGDGTQVELVNGRLMISAAERKRRGPWVRDLIDRLTGSPHSLRIEVPSGSHLEVDTSYGVVRASGPLGTCRVRSSYGEARLDRTGSIDVRVRHGDVAVDHVTGHAEIVMSSGDVRLGMVDGTAAVSNDHSDIDIGTITGTLRLSGAHGEMRVGRACSDVRARSAYGGVRVEEVVAGSVDLSTTYGDLEIGIARGTAAWLDVSSASGSVRNDLTTRPGPDGFERTVEVRAHTRDGNVVVRRA
ncbi:DUF4097 family beta strand repeat-containing protein [Pseudonocardia sp. CA-107938]|uniref:DUF4097 family beta strand repeat-containing protein n=1 Tax=Pseudonocardia sp. CA-107938 TaxID=3240021 RepID=UPI003D9462D6